MDNIGGVIKVEFDGSMKEFNTKYFIKMSTNRFRVCNKNGKVFNYRSGYGSHRKHKLDNYMIKLSQISDEIFSNKFSGIDDIKSISIIRDSGNIEYIKREYDSSLEHRLILDLRRNNKLIRHKELEIIALNKIFGVSDE
jgi:hypothetical protein